MTSIALQELRVDGSTAKIIAAAYHRNGGSGEGFFVGLVLWDERTMMVTYFPGHADPHVAVIDVAQAVAGNIYMHPEGAQAGGNAWRGDHWVHVAEAIKELA